MCYIKKIERAGYWWLMPVILATQEAKNQEDHSSNLVWTNSSQDPILKPSTKSAGGVAQGEGPEFKVQYCKKKKKLKEEKN
jgi:hypothetical protein